MADDDADYGLADADERDEEDRIREFAPAPRISPFEAPDISSLSVPDATVEFAKRVAQIAVVNRALPNEGVPDCEVSLGSARARTNRTGVAALDLTSIVDGHHELLATAPDVFSGPVGPGFPSDTTKERIWRPLRAKVRLQGGRIVESDPRQWVKPTARGLEVHLGPVWMRSPLFSNRPNPPDMIVIHHTAGELEGDLREFLYNGQVSVHYVVAPNGEIYKLVPDDKKAAHAGASHWDGAENLNSRSIGIEMSHKTGVEYPPEQVNSVVELVGRLKNAFPSMPAARVVGHSDIGICDPNSRKPCKPPAPKRLGRKSTDPGSAFPWERIEALGLSFQLAEGTVSADIYGGFFKLVPTGSLRRGDNDEERRYGGRVRRTVVRAVRDLQEDLQQLGYYCPPDGAYGLVTERAVQMFQQRVFSGSRRTGSPDRFNSGDGTLDVNTGECLKRALGETHDAFSISNALLPSSPLVTTSPAWLPRAALGTAALIVGTSLIRSAVRAYRAQDLASSERFPSFVQTQKAQRSRSRPAGALDRSDPISGILRTASKESIPDALWAKMQGRSWHGDRGCPAREDLSLLTVPYCDFDGNSKVGPMILSRAVADEVLDVFAEIFESRDFRIQRIELVDDYDGDDDRSMAANNTSGFNCRMTRGGKRLSAHGRGLAIDINPIQNPFVKGSETAPPEGKPYDRPSEREAAYRRGEYGIIMPGDAVTTAFARQGWKWGGNFTSRKDYQHFSADGT